MSILFSFWCFKCDYIFQIINMFGEQWVNSSGRSDAWAPSRYKDRLSQVWNSHVKDKTVMRPSYLLHGDPYTGKSTSLYWDGPQIAQRSLVYIRSGNSHYLERRWLIVNWKLRHKRQWNFNQIMTFFIEYNPFENAVCKMAVILFRLEYVNSLCPSATIWRHRSG